VPPIAKTGGNDHDVNSEPNVTRSMMIDQANVTNVVMLTHSFQIALMPEPSLPLVGATLPERIPQPLHGRVGNGQDEDEEPRDIACIDTVEQIIHDGMDHFYLHGLNDQMPAYTAGRRVVNVEQRFDSLHHMLLRRFGFIQRTRVPVNALRASSARLEFFAA
jgi:hypothetical protein